MGDDWTPIVGQNSKPVNIKKMTALFPVIFHALAAINFRR